tara:strand:+ start:213 stop:545 length:333 start_codon:yes stop_codon:yes gene_type:complete
MLILNPVKIKDRSNWRLNASGIRNSERRRLRSKTVGIWRLTTLLFQRRAQLLPSKKLVDLAVEIQTDTTHPGLHHQPHDPSRDSKDNRNPSELRDRLHQHQPQAMATAHQ